MTGWSYNGYIAVAGSKEGGAEWVGLHDPAGWYPPFALRHDTNVREKIFICYVNVFIHYSVVEQVTIHLLNTRGLLKTFDKIFILYIRL